MTCTRTVVPLSCWADDMAGINTAAASINAKTCFIAPSSLFCRVYPKQACRDAGILVRNAGAVRSVGLGARELDHLAPFLGLLPEELAELSGRPRKRRAA